LAAKMIQGICSFCNQLISKDFLKTKKHLEINGLSKIWAPQRGFRYSSDLEYTKNRAANSLFLQ